MKLSQPPGPSFLGKVVSHLEYRRHVEAGNLPDLIKGLESTTGRRLNDKEMDDIQVFSYEDKHDGILHVGMKFLHKNAYRVSINLITDALNPFEIEAFHNLRITGALSRELKVYGPEHIDIIRRSDLMGDGRVANWTQPMRDDDVEDNNPWQVGATGSPAAPPRRARQKPGYRSPSPREQSRFATTKHNVSYNKTTGYVDCSCLDTKTKWCPVIREQIEKGVDIPVVEDAVKHIKYNSKLKSIDVLVPVMPRATMRLKLVQYDVSDPNDEGTYTEELRFEYGDYIKVWHEEGMGLRSILIEAFAILQSSGAIEAWAERVNQARYCLENRRSGRVKFTCSNKWHDWKKDELLYTMVKERIESDSSPVEQTQNMAYLATLFAFYDMFESRCYSCYVGFQPENDIPEI